MKFTVTSTLDSVGELTLPFDADSFVEARETAQAIADKQGWREYNFRCLDADANEYNRDLCKRMGWKPFQVGL